MLAKRIAILLLTFLPFSASAAPDKASIIDVLEQYRLNVESINPTAIDGLHEVVTDGGVVYANDDASYFIFGSMYRTKDGESVNLTELALAERNERIMERADIADSVITFPAQDEKHVITVFTDTTCGYCVKLHSEMAEYNQRGITVQYLAFPRAGVRAKNFAQMSAIWCADDRQKAMDDAKSQRFSQTSAECDSTIKRHYALGKALGVTGTPAIILEDGRLIGGYLPPAQLENVINSAG